MRMNLNSFRLKFALLAGLLMAGLLLVTGGFLWRVTHQTGLARLDRELLNLAQPNLDQEHGPSHYQRFEETLSVLGGEPATFVLLVLDEHGKIQHVSLHWPKSLMIRSFPIPAQYAASLPGARAAGSPSVGAAKAAPLPQKIPRFEAREAGEASWRFAVMGNARATLVLGKSLRPFNEEMRALRRLYLFGTGAAMLLAGLGAWWLARQAMRPITALTQNAERVTVAGMNQRIPLLGHDQEFERLIQLFNQMLERMEANDRQLTRFNAEALRGIQARLAQLKPATVGGTEQNPDGGRSEEVQRLGHLVQKLLLAMAETGRLPLDRQPVNLSRLLNTLAQTCQTAVPGLRVKWQLEPEVQIKADAGLLHQALHLVIGHVMEVNPPPETIRFELMTRSLLATLRIVCAGTVIPIAVREHIFAGQPDTQGIEQGLGLKLAREMIRAHDGDLTLEPPEGNLTVFTIRLPMVKNQ